jgi:hypothetical protein
MQDFQLLRNIRKKENKTDEDKLLLHYYKILGMISLILVDEPKIHIDQNEAIVEIRKEMQKMNISLEYL